MDFNTEVTKALKKAGIKEIKLDRPPNPELGDLSFGCFTAGKNPVEKAKELSLKIKPTGMIKKIVAVGPYVNFYIDNEKFVNKAVKEAIKKDFGKGKKKDKILIEHTSINPNASPHVGRARNALIGDCLSRVMKYHGHSIEIHYYVNDIGKQIAMLVYYLQKNKIKSFTFDEILGMYIKINAEILRNVSMEKKVFELLDKIEKGDKKTIKAFQSIVGKAVKGQLELLNELGIKYDVFDYESSFVNSKLLKEVEKKLKKYTFKSEDDRIVLDLQGYDLPMKTPVLVLKRSNGSSLYGLRDLAYNRYKMKKSKHNIVLLGEDHKLYYLQLKAAFDLMKEPLPDVIHYSFILLKSGKMSTRQGNVVLLKDFMQEAVKGTKEELLKRNPDADLKEIEKLAKIIGYGAIKYGILRVSAGKNVIFDWEDALNFEGESAPYLQYTYVRGKRILEKLKLAIPKTLVLTNDSEIKLVKKIMEFPKMIEEVSKNHKVNLLAKYAFDLATQFNEFYEKHSVINETDETIKKSRYALVKAYVNTIKKTLYLLGIDVPDFM